LTFHEGGIYGLLGKNGTGKSTLLYLTMGLLHPQKGAVTYQGIDTRLRRPETLRDMFIVPEEYNLPGITLKSYLKVVRPFYPRFSDEILDTCLEGFGMPKELPPADLKLVAYDFGIKRNILRNLRLQGFHVTVVPAYTPAEEVLSMKPDGVFFSNGPGDPAGVKDAVKNAQTILGKVPVMGICLGLQILGLASGAKTGRLKFGHHGGNHPVMFMESGRVMVTSQNHNFAVLDESIDPEVLEITHVNLNDHSIEGFRSKKVPMIAVQFHPEAAPGPHDSNPFFEDCRKLVVKNKK
jgi:carbamoyl-phosphate synthase small subunit